MAKSGATAETPVKENPAVKENVKGNSESPYLPAVKEVLKFELMASAHIGYDRFGNVRMWNVGDIVECYRTPVVGEPLVPFDLAMKFNQGPDSIKFRRVPSDMRSSPGMKMVDGNPVMDDQDYEKYAENMYNPKPKKGGVRNDGNDDAYSSMSMEELIAFAQENEIPLSGVSSREAVIRELREYENQDSLLNL